MAGVRFTELQSRPMALLDFTSVTLDEFRQLVHFITTSAARVVTCLATIPIPRPGSIVFPRSIWQDRCGGGDT